MLEYLEEAPKLIIFFKKPHSQLIFGFYYINWFLASLTQTVTHLSFGLVAILQLWRILTNIFKLISYVYVIKSKYVFLSQNKIVLNFQTFFFGSIKKTVIQNVVFIRLIQCIGFVLGTALIQRPEIFPTNGWSTAPRSISYERFVPSTCYFCNVRSGAA